MRAEKRWAAMALVQGLALGLALLSGCGGGSEAPRDSARLRLLNASAGYAALDLAVDGGNVNSGVAFGAVGGYASVATSGVTTAVSSSGSVGVLSSASRSLNKDGHYTLVAYGPAGALKTQLIADDLAAPANNLTSVQVQHLAPDAGSLDVYLTGSSDALEGATPLAANLAAGSGQGASSVIAATYRLRVTGSGDKTDLRLDVQGLVLRGGQVGTLVLSQGAGGVLVHGIWLVQQGKAGAMANPQARLRVVSAVAGGASVSLTVAGTSLANASLSPNIGAYTLVTGGSAVPVLLAVNNRAVAVADQPLSAGGDYTLLVWGDAAAPRTTWLTDDNSYPTALGNAKLRLINASSGAPVALTLKVDLSTLASAVAPGQASAFATVPASSLARLDIGSASNPSLKVLPGVNLAAKGVYSVVVLGDSAALDAVLRKDR